MHGTIKKIKFESQSLKQIISLSIYLPETYSPIETYPVLFTLDGNDYFKLGNLVQTTEQLLQDGEIGEYLIVGIPYLSLQDRRDKYEPSGSMHEQFKIFITQELLPFIAKKFYTNPSISPYTIIGESLAGTAAIVIAFEFPNLFRNIIIQSPFVNNDVLTMIKQYSLNSKLSIYHVVGTDETNVKLTNGEQADFLTPNKELRNILMEKNDGYYFFREFNGGHMWKYWKKEIRDALIYIFQ